MKRGVQQSDLSMSSPALAVVDVSSPYGVRKGPYSVRKCEDVASKGTAITGSGWSCDIITATGCLSLLQAVRMEDVGSE